MPRRTQVAFLLLALAVLLPVIQAGIRRDSLLNQGLAHRQRLGLGARRLDQSGISQLWFTQPLDHADSSNTATWKQQIFVNDNYFGGNGSPIFLFLGGEGPLGNSSVTGHYIVNEFAQQMSALIVSAEHRFYGKSVPTEDLSAENLKYLTSQQALADFANVAMWVREVNSCPDSPIISVGGSYSGALSAWMRKLYPDLISVAWASSAPVQALANFEAYYQVVDRSLGPQCAGAVKFGVHYVEETLKESGGIQELEQAFKACDSIETSADGLANFMMSISDPISGVVQYNLDNNGRTQLNIPDICRIILAGSPIATLPAVIGNITLSGSDSCNDVSFTSTMKQLSDVTPGGPNAAARAWTWQTCNEFGYFQTGTGHHIPFSKLISLDYYFDICSQVYGVDSNDVLNRIDSTNAYYAAKNITTVASRILFSNGSVDPWHKLGITKTPNTSNAAFFIPGTAHCADLYASSPNDSAFLQNARADLQATLEAWLFEPPAPAQM